MLYIAGGSSSRLSGGGGGGEEVLQVVDVVRGLRPFCHTFCSPGAVAQTRTFCITRCATKQGKNAHNRGHISLTYLHDHAPCTAGSPGSTGRRHACGFAHRAEERKPMVSRIMLSSYSIEPFRDHIVPHVVLKIVPDFHTWFPRLFQISPLL